jgi:ribosomal protein S27E
MLESRQNVSPRSRSLLYVACDQCGCEVTKSVHNVSRLVQCIECGLIFVNPRPAFDDLAPQYEQAYFHCAHPTFGGYEDYEGDRNDVLKTFARRIASLASILPAARPKALDVGCATGIFLEAATQAGWDVEGSTSPPMPSARRRKRACAHAWANCPPRTTRTIRSMSSPCGTSSST